MTPELLRRAGEAIFGDRWQKPLATGLGVRDDTVRHWLNGRQAVPPGAAEEIKTALADKREEIDRILAQEEEESDVLPR